MKDKALFAIVESRGAAEDIVAALVCEGFASGDLSVVVPSHGASAEVSVRDVGMSVLGILSGPGVFAVSGIGPIVAAGPIAPILAAAASASAALIQLGMSEEQALDFETDLVAGSVLLAVHANENSEVDAAKTVLITIRLRQLGHRGLRRLSN